MNLYQRHRPTKFSEMIGDFSSLENNLSSSNPSHAFLFVGPSGCGKTTLARILATSVGASEMDIQEYNCSDKNGVDDMRSIVEGMHLSSFSPAKVIILDECHKITDAGQNCLLKALEDTPSHVYFVLCSSEPNKIIKAIKTRCTTFQLPLIDEDSLFTLLKSVTKAEGVKIKNDILDKIVEVAEGSARQALVILEDIIATPEEKQLDKLETIGYGTASPQAIDLMRCIFDFSPWKEISSILLALKEAGVEAEGLRRAVLGYGTAILLKKPFDSKVAKIMKCFVDNTYDSGFNGFVVQCARAYESRKALTEEIF